MTAMQATDIHHLVLVLVLLATLSTVLQVIAMIRGRG